VWSGQGLNKRKTRPEANYPAIRKNKDLIRKI
jgi:hypothetical protein